MPVGFNSAARNLFLLGSSGADLVTNFFKRIDRSAETEGVYIPDEIKYNIPDQKFILAGTNQDSQAKQKGWFEKRTSSGSLDWNVKISSTQQGVNTTLKALEIDGNDNLIVCGKTGTVPWIAKYDNDGNISWQVSSNTAGVEYTGIAIDSNNDLYACGSSATEAFIEKIDGTGTYSWGKYSSNVAGAITFVKCAANDRGEVVAVGKIEDTVKDKGYIAKVDTTTGALLWDRTLEDFRLGASNSYLQTECTDVYIDSNDQIYIIGNIFDNVDLSSKAFLIKYSPEGNIIWQKETEYSSHYFRNISVKSDGETEQTIVLSQFSQVDYEFLILSKYSKNGDLLWRRNLYSDSNFPFVSDSLNLDADPSFYYLLFVDENINLLSNSPQSYIFGKVSSSGNGLGAFTYEPDGSTTLTYEIMSSSGIVNDVSDNIGRLSDGSVRVDTSDLITYPFGANKILFDDLATQVANKKVQVDEAGTYSDPTYSITTGYPKISKDAIVYDSSLLLNYDFKNKATYPGTGTSTNNLSSTSYPGTINGGAVFNSAGYFTFDGSNDYIINSSVSGLPTGNTARTIELWAYPISNTNCWVQLGTGGGGNQVYIFQSYQISSLIYLFTDGVNSNNNLTISGSQVPTLNQWNHLVFQNNGQSWNYYKNGSSVASGTFPTTINTNGGKFIIGWRDDSSASTSNARYGEVRIYNKALTSTEISQNFNATRSKYGV